MNPDTKIVMGIIVKCFANVIIGEHKAHLIRLPELTDENFVDLFKQAALEPDFDKFYDEFCPKPLPGVRRTPETAKKPWKVAWRLARCYEPCFKPTKPTDVPAQN